MLTLQYNRQWGSNPPTRYRGETTMTDVKTLRNRLGLTQPELAVQAGVSISSVSRMESGKKPNKSTLKLVAAVLGVAPEQITFSNTSQAPEQTRE